MQRDRRRAPPPSRRTDGSLCVPWCSVYSVRVYKCKTGRDRGDVKRRRGNVLVDGDPRAIVVWIRARNSASVASAKRLVVARTASSLSLGRESAPARGPVFCACACVDVGACVTCVYDTATATRTTTRTRTRRTRTRTRRTRRVSFRGAARGLRDEDGESRTGTGV